MLWKQDVDLGFTLVEPATTLTKKPSTSEKESADEIEKLKALEAINATYQKVRKDLYLLPFIPIGYFALFEFCSVYFYFLFFIFYYYFFLINDVRFKLFQPLPPPIAASNERLSLENASLSAFTHVRRKHLLPRTQFKRSFLHMPTGPLMSSCVPRTIIGEEIESSGRAPVC